VGCPGEHVNRPRQWRSGSKAQVLLHLTFAMRCDEAVRLRRKYDAALMYWGKTLFLARHTESKVNVDRLILAARNARNEAANCLVRHQRECALCRRDKMKLV
jgi:hypothetical protein